MKNHLTNLILIFSLYSSITGIALDNEVVDTPEIQCTEDTINFTVKTRNIFKGNIYVRGQFSNPQCRKQYYNNDYAGATFTIKIGECGMSRIRQLQPHGMNYMLVFVTNFHQSFVTKIDRAYNVRCFYAQADKIVHSELEVSQIHTEEVAHSAMLMPHCEYSVHRKTIDGDLVRYVNVGDPIVHKWECDNPNYGMLVKNCEIKDGTGFTKQVLDEKGCPTYSHDIFGQPKYDSELKRAYVPTFAYKLPDVSQLFFECQIQVCNKRENECDGITPPNCPSVALPEFGHNSFVKPNIDPTQVIGTFDHVAFQPSFIPSLKPDVDSRQDNRITSNIAFPSRDALSNEIPVDRSYPRFYPERTVILQAHQQPYFRRKDSPTPTETNDILGNNLADDWSFWRNSTPLILKRSSRSTTSATRTYTNEKLNNRIRRAEDETMDVMSPLMVLDKDVDIGEFYKDDIIVDVKASNLSKSKPICLDKTGMGIIIGCFAFLSTCSLAMTTYIVYDICIKRKKHRKGIITRRSPSDCTDTESLESAGSRKSNPPSNRSLILPRISRLSSSRVEPQRNIAFEKY